MTAKKTKPAKQTGHHPVVRTHDDGRTWEGACRCGWRAQCSTKQMAENAVAEHRNI